jgi:hypothetical protein
MGEMMIERKHLYAVESQVYYGGRATIIKKLSRTLRGEPVYYISGSHDPVREVELSPVRQAKDGR